MVAWHNSTQSRAARNALPCRLPALSGSSTRLNLGAALCGETLVHPTDSNVQQTGREICTDRVPVSRGLWHKFKVMAWHLQDSTDLEKRNSQQFRLTSFFLKSYNVWPHFSFHTVSLKENPRFRHQDYLTQISARSYKKTMWWPWPGPCDHAFIICHFTIRASRWKAELFPGMHFRLPSNWRHGLAVKKCRVQSEKAEAHVENAASKKGLELF